MIARMLKRLMYIFKVVLDYQELIAKALFKEHQITQSHVQRSLELINNDNRERYMSIMEKLDKILKRFPDSSQPS